MGKLTGFKEYERKVNAYQAIEKRKTHYKEFLVPLKEDELQNQGARCMDCGVPFCHQGCPLGNIIPDWNHFTYKNQWEQAYYSLSSTNNFPEVTGRICPAPCESACVLGINKPPVAIKVIEHAIAERAFLDGKVKPKKVLKRTGKKIVIVGSGPAGLACADQLNKAGHHVTVYEKSDRIGGLLRYGIPDFKLEKNILDRRINLLQQEGIVFKTSVLVGRDISKNQLTKQYDAIVIAIGSQTPRNLPIKGRQSHGVYFAMDFLIANNKKVAGDNLGDSFISARGKHVVVLGGGDTGSDCVGTSIRQQAKKVTQIELMDKPPFSRDLSMPWPLYDRIFRTSSSQEEGCQREFGLLTKEFISNAKGNLEGLKCVRLKWNQFSKGIPIGFEEIPNTDFIVKADLIFLAMGFLHPNHGDVLKELDLKKSSKGNIDAKENSYQTNQKGVFACGDARRGQSLVVWAILEGRECARYVDLYLNKNHQHVCKINAKGDSLKTPL